jgi:hypothetical protein
MHAASGVTPFRDTKRLSGNDKAALIEGTPRERVADGVAGHLSGQLAGRASPWRALKRLGR